MVGDRSTGDQVLSDGVGDLEALEDWDSVGDTIAGVADGTGGSSVGIEGENGLDGDVKSLDIVGLEHDFGHLLSVGLWVEWGLSEEDSVLGGINSELVGKAVLPDFVHELPLGNDTGGNWVGKVEDTSEFLGFITNVLIFLLSTDDSCPLWLSYDGWELDAWGSISGHTGFDNS